MSNSTSLIASITTIEEACAAFGYHRDEDGDWSRKAKSTLKATIEAYEMKFGIPKKVYVEEMAPIDLDEDADNERNLWIPVLTIPQNTGKRTRVLSHTLIPFDDYQFPTNFRAITQYIDYEEPNGDVMFVGNSDGHEWMCFDVVDKTVMGLALGTFTEMFERFVNATPIDLELSYFAYLRSRGEVGLRSLHNQAVIRAKQEVATWTKRHEARVARRMEAVSKGLLMLHESLEDIIKVEHIGSEVPVQIHYRLVFMANHQAEMQPDISANDVHTELYGLMKMHAKAKRMGEIAWVYRSVNNQSVPHAIWNPGSQLWELL